MAEMCTGGKLESKESKDTMNTSVLLKGGVQGKTWESGAGEKENTLYGTQALDPWYSLGGKAICFFCVICFFYEHKSGINASHFDVQSIMEYSAIVHEPFLNGL